MNRIKYVMRNLWKRYKLYGKNVFILCITVVLVFIIIYEGTSKKPTRNIIWSNHLHESEIIDKVYMKYDENVLNDLDSAFLTRNDYFNAAQQTAIDKSVIKIKEVTKFRSKFKNNESLIVEESKKRFKRYNTKENYMHVYMLNFSKTDIEEYLANIKFESETCKFEINVTGPRHEGVIELMAGCIDNDIKSIIGKSIMIGIDTDQSYTNVLPAIFKEHKPDSKIGFIVFDEHITIFDMGFDNVHNVFGKNLAEEKIDRIIFLGVSQDNDTSVRSYFNINLTKKALLDKIEVYYDTEHGNRDFKPRLSESIKRMKEEGITNIIFSVDVDVLPEAYTGFEYSILAPAMSLAKYYKYYYDMPVQHLGQVDFKDPFYRGLTPEEIINTINFIKQEAVTYNIKVGFDIYNATFVGDIEGLLPEQDLNFRTTDAAVKISEVMTQ